MLVVQPDGALVLVATVHQLQFLVAAKLLGHLRSGDGQGNQQQRSEEEHRHQHKAVFGVAAANGLEKRRHGINSNLILNERQRLRVVVGNIFYLNRGRRNLHDFIAMIDNIAGIGDEDVVTMQ